jgi:hypothetical protein
MAIWYPRPVPTFNRAYLDALFSVDHADRRERRQRLRAVRRKRQLNAMDRRRRKIQARLPAVVSE